MTAPGDEESSSSGGGVTLGVDGDETREDSGRLWELEFMQHRASITDITEIEPAVDRVLTQQLLDWTTPPGPVPPPVAPSTILAKPPSILPPPNTSGARVIDPGQLADIYVERAMKRQDEGDHEGAISDYTKALARAPAHALARYNRGVAYLAMLRYEEALADFVQSLRHNAALAEASYNSALALLVMGHKADAVRFGEHAFAHFQLRGDREMADKARVVIARASDATPRVP